MSQEDPLSAEVFTVVELQHQDIDTAGRHTPPVHTQQDMVEDTHNTVNFNVTGHVDRIASNTVEPESAMSQYRTLDEQWDDAFEGTEVNDNYIDDDDDELIQRNNHGSSNHQFANHELMLPDESLDDEQYIDDDEDPHRFY